MPELILAFLPPSLTTACHAGSATTWRLKRVWISENQTVVRSSYGPAQLKMQLKVWFSEEKKRHEWSHRCTLLTRHKYFVLTGSPLFGNTELQGRKF